MNEIFLQELEKLPSNLAGHLQISILSLALGLLISLPVSLVAIWSKTLRYPLLMVVSVIQTVPSLALLALMVALFGQTGFFPTIVALTLYSMLPIVRNIVTGILDVDPALTEAARGVGMTPFQSFYQVELPLALPVIIAGIRTATVWTVGIATLATPVGQTCLGNYIFTGLNTQNNTAVLFGCVSAAILAIGLDLLIGGLQKAAEDRNISLAGICGGLLVAIGLFGAGLGVAKLFESPKVVIGAKGFTEQLILGDLIADRLDEDGIPTTLKTNLGSKVVFDAVKSGSVSLYVDYTGTIWSNYMKRDDIASPEEVASEVSTWLKENYGIETIGPLGFENSYALAMRAAQAKELNIETLNDLASHSNNLKIGGDLEFFIRPEWKALKKQYGFEFADRTTYDPTFMYEAVAKKNVDVISAFSTDGRIFSYDLKVLEDPKQAIPPYDAIILVSPKALHREKVIQALEGLKSTISADVMRQANAMVDREKDKKATSEAAKWLREQIDQN